MAEKGRNDMVVSNRRAKFEYELMETFQAGMMLTGTEVKSLRGGKANLQEAFIYVNEDGAFIKGMNIAEYEKGGYTNHDPLRERKLLLRKKELAKLKKGIEQKGYTIVPLKVYFGERNLAKMDIALGRGKKIHDKRDSIKDRDVQRETARQIDNY
ncbi:MAG: SsrA-binding protein SmpB [Bacteroidia bacterium]|nr:SsrA-binding protein SmpB [Bacteroidia bacterium]